MKKLIVILFCAIAISSTLAGETSDARIVVTADRIEHPATDIPADIVVIDKDDLKNKTVVEALESCAGLSFQSYNGNSTQASISMHGFGENSHGRVLVLVDGIRQNNADMSGIDWVALPESAIERIEVLQGGASAIYGSGAVAGVINIITRKAGSDKGIAADARMELSSFGGIAEKFYVSGSGKRTSVALSGSMEHSDGWRDRTMYDIKCVNAKLGYSAEDVFSADLLLSAFDSGYEMAGAIDKSTYKKDPKSAAYYDDDADLSGYSVSLLSKFKGSDAFCASLSASFRRKENMTDMESWGTWTTTGSDCFFVSPSAIFSVEGEIFSDSVNLGLDFMHDRIESKGYSDSLRCSRKYSNDVSKKGAGIFASDDLRLLDDALTLTFGARFDYEKIEAFDDSVEFTPFSLTAGINYLFSDGSNAYFRYDRVFRTPFTDEQVNYQGYGDGFNTGLDPESGNSFEVGFNLNSIKCISVGASGYALLMKDEIAYDNVTWENENMNDTLHCGVNARAKLHLKYLSLLATYSWTWAEFTDGEFDGNDIPLVPSHVFTVSPVFYLPWGFRLSADLRYTGSTYAGQDYANALEKNDAYFLTDIELEYKSSGRAFDVAIFGRINNLFDTEYASCAYVGYDSAFNAITTFYPGSGREFVAGGTFSY